MFIIINFLNIIKSELVCKVYEYINIYVSLIIKNRLVEKNYIYGGYRRIF